MSSSLDYLEYVLSLIDEDLDITYKKMMGEYLLYSQGVLFGGIYDNRFLIKKTDSNIDKDMSLERPYEHGSMMYFVDFEDRFKIKEVILCACRDLSKK